MCARAATYCLIINSSEQALLKRWAQQALILVVAWVSDLAGFGLRVDGFWWGVLGALVLSILTAIFNGLLGTTKSKIPKG